MEAWWWFSNKLQGLKAAQLKEPWDTVYYLAFFDAFAPDAPVWPTTLNQAESERYIKWKLDKAIADVGILDENKFQEIIVNKSRVAVQKGLSLEDMQKGLCCLLA